MRKTFLFAATAAMALAGTLASCSNDDNVFESPAIAKTNPGVIGFNMVNDHMAGTRGVSIEEGNTGYLDQISAYDFQVVAHIMPPQPAPEPLLAAGILEQVMRQA
mgnify:CR=1 FL=1